MTSQSREKACKIMTDYSVYDNAIGTLQPSNTNIQYETVYVDPASEELKERVKHLEGDVKRLEGDIDFLRGMLIDLYSNCPKMKHDFSGNKKKVNKDDAVECENCGGLLW